jgi:hypothetical protein
MSRRRNRGRCEMCGLRATAEGLFWAILRLPNRLLVKMRLCRRHIRRPQPQNAGWKAPLENKTPVQLRKLALESAKRYLDNLLAMRAASTNPLQVIQLDETIDRARQRIAELES